MVDPKLAWKSRLQAVASRAWHAIKKAVTVLERVAWTAAALLTIIAWLNATDVDALNKTSSDLANRAITEIRQVSLVAI